MNITNVIKKISIIIGVILMIAVSIGSGMAIPGKAKIIPSSLDLVININKTQIVQVEIENPYNETLYNLRFTNTSQYMEIPQTISFLHPKESATVIFKFYSDRETYESFVSVLSFDYLLEVSQYPVTYPITINDTGFPLDNLTIYEGDSVFFLNNGTYSHSLTEINLTQNSLDINLSANETYNLTPDRTYDFFDRATGDAFRLRITPRDPSSYVHSSSLDKSFPIHLRAIPEPVTLNLEILTPEHTIEFNESAQGVIRLHNPHNATAYEVNLSAQWTNFTENMLDIPGKTTRVITYNISPQNIVLTNQTNMTYNLSISAKGLNLEGLNGTNLSISVYVPYRNLSYIKTDSGTIIELPMLSIDETLAVCNAEPEYPGCDKLYKEKIVEVIRTIKENASLPPDIAEQILKKIESMENIITRQGNAINAMKEIIDEDVKDDIGDTKRDIDSIEGDIKGILEEFRAKNIRGIWTKVVWGFIIGMISIAFLILIAVKKGRIKETLLGWRQ